MCNSKRGLIKYKLVKGMPMAPMGGPQSSPCPTPAMQGHSQSTGPKPWSDGKYCVSVYCCVQGRPLEM